MAKMLVYIEIARCSECETEVNYNAWFMGSRKRCQKCKADLQTAQLQPPKDKAALERRTDPAKFRRKELR